MYFPLGERFGHWLDQSGICADQDRIFLPSLSIFGFQKLNMVALTYEISVQYISKFLLRMPLWK